MVDERLPWNGDVCVHSAELLSDRNQIPLDLIRRTQFSLDNMPFVEREPSYLNKARELPGESGIIFA